jgi:hypothetical protein
MSEWDEREGSRRREGGEGDGKERGEREREMSEWDEREGSRRREGVEWEEGGRGVGGREGGE